MKRAVTTGVSFGLTSGTITTLGLLVPILVFDLGSAIMLSVALGFSIITLLSWALARAQHVPPWKVIGEHLLIAAVVVAATHLLGDWLATIYAGSLRKGRGGRAVAH